jgi:glucose-6-phosphate dehydrogenase assembly protein OpcA
MGAGRGGRDDVGRQAPLEDIVTAKNTDVLLPGGRDVPFGEIESTLARLVRDGRRRRRAPARSLTATVIVVGSDERLAAASDALEQLGDVGLRSILISQGENPSPTARVSETVIAIAGLAPRYLNNAVAALRLSSLPALVWWRGGSEDALDDLAELADRLVLDVEQPDAIWNRAPALIERTALTDMRWTRLTRWRSTLAHLFDLPQLVEAAQFEKLSIAASDPDAARLFAGWLRARLKWTPAVKIQIENSGQSADPAAPLSQVSLEGPNVWIEIQVKPGAGCLAARVDGVDGSARIVPLGDGSLAGLIGEELGVRSRDLAFEEALASAREIRL